MARLKKQPQSRNHIRDGTKRIVLIAVLAATLTGGKTALAVLPNIEIVTLLTALYGYVFGVLGLFATLIFVMVEMLIWGIGPWAVSYLIYWPLVCALFMLMGKMRVKNRYILTALAVTLTLFFGVLTSLVDVGLFMGAYERFWYRFSIYYMRGIVYYALHIGCNLALFLLVFPPLKGVMERHGKRLIM